MFINMSDHCPLTDVRNTTHVYIDNKTRINTCIGRVLNCHFENIPTDTSVTEANNHPLPTVQ